jgi:alkyl sulfatase BDS1-like metallo-beta-lactamase superfamily hydrolase
LSCFGIVPTPIDLFLDYLAIQVNPKKAEGKIANVKLVMPDTDARRSRRFFIVRPRNVSGWPSPKNGCAPR